MRKHLQIRPNLAFIRELKAELIDVPVTHRTARAVLSAFGASRRGATIEHDIRKEFEKRGLYLRSLGNADCSNVDNTVPIRRLDHNLMETDIIYSQAMSESLRGIPLREMLIELESTRPILSNDTIEQISARFEGEHFETLPVVDVESRRIVGVVHHINILKELIKTTGEIPISKSQVVRINAAVGDLLDAFNATRVVVIDLCNGNYFVLRKRELGWHFSRVIREMVSYSKCI
jgi:hypothetical protein